jgi:hypothetical protein
MPDPHVPSSASRSQRATTSRTGALTMRVWMHEPGVPVAHITACLDVDEGSRSEADAATLDGITAFVTEWLKRFVAGDAA